MHANNNRNANRKHQGDHESSPRVAQLRPIAALLLCVLAAPAVLAENLQQIYQQAANKDPEIRQARALYNAKHTVIDQGRSTLLPTITATANGSRDTNGTADPSFDAFGNSRQHSFERGYYSTSYGLRLSQAVVNFQAWYSFQSARKGDEAATLTLAQSEQQLIIKVAKAYFDVLKSEANLASFTAEEAAAKQVLEQTKQRFDVGLVTITDVYDSQAAADQASVSKLVEENNSSRLRETLGAITGQDISDLAPLNAGFPIESADPASVDEWMKLAKENNIAMKIAQLDLDAKQLDAKAAKAATYPTVSLNMNYSWNKSGQTASFFPAQANVGTGVGLSFSMPIFNGGLRSAQTRQAYYNRDASEEALLKSQRDNTMGVRTAYRNIESDVKAVAATAQALLSAQTALESTQVGAEVGTRNIVDVVQSQKVLFQTQRNFATARFTYVIDTLTLKQNAGVLSPQDVSDLNQWLRP